MKKIFLYIMLAFLLIVVNSCVNDLLNKQPLNIISDDVLWNDQALVNAYITDIYSGLTFLEMTEGSDNRSQMGGGSSTDNWFDINLSTELSDEAMCGMPWLWTYYRWKPGYQQLGQTGGLMDFWGYSSIRKMNVFIEKMKTSTLDPTFIKSAIAEVRFLRALSYFEMVKRYGGVPLLTEAQSITTPIDSLYMPRNTEEAIYNFVNSEVDAIVPDLPLVPSETGRASKGAALALKSESSLYAARIATWGTVQLNGLVGIPAQDANKFWQASLDASKAVMNLGVYSLYNKYPNDKVKNFQNIFLDKGNSEVIFAKEYNGSTVGHGWDCFESPAGYNSWGVGNNTAPYVEMVNEFENVDGSPHTLDPTIYSHGEWSLNDLFGKKDPRFAASIYTEGTPYQGDTIHMYRGLVQADGTITTNAIGTTPGTGKSSSDAATGFGTLKYIDESLISPGAGQSKTDWIIFRYAEILLNYAEAAFQLGDPSDALQAVNLVRERAGIPDLTSISQDLIRHERKVEFYGEAKRYWDLRTWRLSTSVLSHSYTGMDYYLDPVTKKYKLQFYDADGAYTPLFNQCNYYWPITLARIANDSLLVENPGY
ncbi:RagB/SusD family nutrient uptake outer membrane protein [Microbacter margulisiae]|uniref:Starch-binding associating with outer membrane n=1 Tax=Microbacter margulisiae TaxID=1350067 RepID=A0A7W5H059_9PORP|nr:RagB/SusD family nutrient uptake outer membrane protein [Microbacter margulisiae]MBB3186198.1 hypothetical protein [Microbacter margulisiae]